MSDYLFCVSVTRRNTSVDESYEWDSADVCVDSEVLEAMRFDQTGGTGVGKGRGELRHDRPRSAGLQDLQRKGEEKFFTTLYVSALDIVCECMFFPLWLMCFSHDSPIHAIHLPPAPLRPISLNQSTSLQPTSLPIQSLPK